MKEKSSEQKAWEEVCLRAELGKSSRLCDHVRTVNGRYRGRCIGRVMAFLKYFPLFMTKYRYDEVFFGKHGISIDREGKHIVADYSWKPDTDIPVFDFKFDDVIEYNETQDKYIQEKIDQDKFSDKFWATMEKEKLKCG